MKQALHLAVCFVAVALSACTCGLVPNPEGAVCDTGNVCTSGYLCIDGRCRSQSGMGGGAGGGGGGVAAGGGAGGGAFGGGAGGGAGGGTSLLCNGVVCNMPPAATCMGTMLRTYAGACNPNTGSCDYTPMDTPCPNGCMNAQCVGNTCMGITCTTPPGPACNGMNVVTSTLPGTCMNGACKYTEATMACANGCANGACIPTPASFGQVLPRVRHQITAVDQRPFSGGDDVLVVGPAGAMSRWNGTQWSSVDAGMTGNLVSVWWASSTVAYAIAETGMLRYTPSTGVVSRITSLPPLVGTARLVDVHGVDSTNLAVVDNAGTFYRFTPMGGGTWTTNNRTVEAPYRMVGVYMESVTGGTRMRYYGACGAPTLGGCVVFQNTSNQIYDDVDNAVSGFRSGGPSVDGEGYLGLSVPQVRRHQGLSGDFDSIATPTGMDGGAVVAITGGASTTSRSTFILTAPTATLLGHLYRVTPNVVPVSPPNVDHLVEVLYGYQAMSKTESTGVIVVDMNTSTNTSTITRRSVIANEVLDLGAEDWVSGSPYPNGSVLLNGYGDVAIRSNTQATFQLRRFPLNLSATDIAGGTAFAVLTADDGTAWRIPYSANSTYSELTFAQKPSALTSICRATDTEWYLVSKTGGIYSYDGSMTRAMTSNTTAALADVDCPGTGAAIACGTGTVLRLNAGAWTAVPNPPAGTITSCKLVQGTIFVGGPNLFARFTNGAWQMLPARAALDGLVVRSVNEAYAASGNVIYRFDGTQWLSAATAPQALLTGFLTGSRVAFAGAGGVVMEGQ